MKAAIVAAAGKAPIYVDFDKPVAKQDEEIISVRAAALSNLTRSRASGAHYSSSGIFPAVAGTDGVGLTQDGRRVYFAMPEAPFGSLAEICPIRIQAMRGNPRFSRRHHRHRKPRHVRMGWTRSCSHYPDVSDAGQNPARRGGARRLWRVHRQARQRSMAGFSPATRRDVAGFPDFFAARRSDLSRSPCPAFAGQFDECVPSSAAVLANSAFAFSSEPIWW